MPRMNARVQSTICVTIFSVAIALTAAGCQGSPKPPGRLIATESSLSSETTQMGYIAASQPLSCDEIAHVGGDLISGLERVTPPAYPNAVDQSKDCIWRSPDSSKSVVVGIEHFTLSAEEMDLLRQGRSPWYQGEYPKYEVRETTRLEKIGAVAVLPQNGPSAIVHLPTLRIEIVGTGSLMALELGTRIAEFVVGNNRLPK